MCAPVLFGFELRAGLWAAERRRQIKRKDVDQEIAAIFSLVSVAAAPDDAAHDGILALARRTALSYYDAAYLDLALRSGATLASRDGALLAAAAKQGATAYDAR